MFNLLRDLNQIKTAIQSDLTLADIQRHIFNLIEAMETMVHHIEKLEREVRDLGVTVSSQITPGKPPKPPK